MKNDVKLGQWLFSHRTYLPVIFIPLFVFLHGKEIESYWSFYLGGFLVVAGEATRIWGVSYAGSITRTRKRRLNKLVTNGPFAHVRNPLYIGNFLLWTGFTIASEVFWLIPIVWLWFFVQYWAIIRWEETILEETFGESYMRYKHAVPCWFPQFSSYPVRSGHRPMIGPALRSERGTFAVIILVVLILIGKELLFRGR